MWLNTDLYQWRIQGAHPARAHKILSLWHTNFTKCSRIGSWRPRYATVYWKKKRFDKCRFQSAENDPKMCCWSYNKSPLCRWQFWFIYFYHQLHPSQPWVEFCLFGSCSEVHYLASGFLKVNELEGAGILTRTTIDSLSTFKICQNSFLWD